MPTSKRFLAGLPLACTLFLASCDQGGGASTAPPPPVPLSWNGVPDEITVAVGEEEIFTATLTAALPASYSVSVNGAVAGVSGEQLRPGVYRVTVVGVEAGEAEIVLKADYPGYVTASGTIDIVVEELFDEHLWRELVFDAYDCPSGDASDLCLGRWGNRQVEDRITVVLPSQPSFHIFIGEGDWRFSSSQERTVRDAIRAAVEQVTGERFTGEITNGRAFANRHGWVDIAPVRDEHWEDQGFFAPCGSLWQAPPRGSSSSTWMKWTPNSGQVR